MQSSLSVCDMGDLLRQLTVDEVDLLTPSSLVSCPAVLARHVTSRPARRRILDVYVDSRTGSVLLRLSVCLSVRPSVRLILAFCNSIRI